MPRTVLTVRTIVRQSGVAISDPAVYVLFDRVNDMQCENDGRTFLAINNIHASATYTLEFSANPALNYDGVTPDPYQWVVPANSSRFVGPFPLAKFGSTLLISSASAGIETNVRITAYRLPGGFYRSIPASLQTIAPRQVMGVAAITRAAGGTTYGAGSGETTADANGATFPNDGQVFFHLRNTTGGAVNSFVSDEGWRDGQSLSGATTVAASIPANSERLVGPFPVQFCTFDQKNLGRMNWATGLMGKAYWLPYQGD